MAKSLSRKAALEEARTLIEAELMLVKQEDELLGGITKRTIDSAHEEGRTLMITLRKTECRLKEMKIKILNNLDSLSYVSDDVNKDKTQNKMQMLDYDKLLNLKTRVNNLDELLRSGLTIKPDGTKDYLLSSRMDDKTAEEFIQKVSEVRMGIIKPLIEELEALRKELIVIEISRENKEKLGEDQRFKEDHLKEGEKPKNGWIREMLNFLRKKEFVTYYHAAGSSERYEQSQLDTTRDIYFADRPKDAVSQRMGFSARRPDFIIELKIDKRIAGKYIKPYTVESYTDANMECFCLNKEKIPQINKLIKKGYVKIIVKRNTLNV